MKKLLSFMLCLVLLLSAASVSLAEAEHGDLWIGHYTLPCWTDSDGTIPPYYNDYNDTTL